MSVLAHDCRTKPGADRGLPFTRCDCLRRISLREARALVEMGLAVWKLQKKADGGIVEMHGEVILLKQHPLRARLPSQRDVLNGKTIPNFEGGRK